MKVNWRRYVETNPAIMLGKLVIMGTRITVELSVERLAERESVHAIFESHPDISRKAIRACLAYTSDIIRNETSIPVR